MNRFKPVISLHGSGESVVLSNGAHADFTLMQGASGLGVRPQEISSVALPSGGSLVSHRRGTEAVIQLPILLGGTPRKRWDLRRRLERLCAGEVEVRVSRPNGVYRSRFGFYQAGLDGEYGAGEDSPDGQKIVLEIFSPTGLWQGEEQSPEFRLAGLRKRFLSDRAGMVPTGRLNYARNPSFEHGTDHAWARSGITVTNPESDTAYVGSRVMRSVVTGGSNSAYTYMGQYASPDAVIPGKWIAARFAQRWVSGSHWMRGRINYTGGQPFTEVVDGSDGNWHIFTVAAQITEGTKSIGVAGYVFDNAGFTVPPVKGTTVEQDGFMFAVADSEDEALAAVAEYKDGDSLGWGWSQEPHSSLSVEYKQKASYQSPFLPIVLASSTVQGNITVEIGGDAPAYPTWIVDGPGTDLIIENDEGEHLKVLTEFSEQVTITTDPLMQDIVSPNNPDGELWEFVPTKSKFFPLKPGKNRLKVSMVGAKPNSRVRLLYRETYKAGW